MIQIQHLSKSFQSNQVLQDISFDIASGQVVALIGSSGAGKSTLLRTLNFLERAESGRITLDDLSIDVATAKKTDILQLRKATAMVFQQFNLFQQKTALQNVMEGLVVVKGIPKEEARKIAEEQLAKVGLFEQADFYPKHLSGGQQQRVAIARALAMQPKLLLLDEPTSALDPELVGEVLDTIKEAAKEGYTMLLVSHEMNFVRKVADQVLFLDQGKVIESGTAEEVFERPQQYRTRKFLTTFYRDRGPEYMI
ncbi:amino acid ABC transporter ATP-binding protein [Enterococcus pingfangensis]|uniref:amino acid ABC transporter ATP-binding protein n=1 Tax=Enterococcus pingfangensis TaxID=2559924 RepID=UPI0010F8F35A|nr:amino acid ABC transporter ATP-binding protein [Enterococcus pingfangensis]